MATAGVLWGELYYERAGEGEPLLAIQGMSGTHLAWGETFRPLLEKSFDTVVFDNRGAGRSGPVEEEEFTIAAMAKDARELLDALNIESAHVLGISMGGMIAQELALEAPERVRSLTLGCTYCGGPGAELMDPADFQVLAAALDSGDPERVYRAGWEINLSAEFRAEESRYAEFRDMAAALPVPRRTIELQLGAIFGHDTSARLPSLAPPTLVLHGTDDLVLPVANGRQIASLVPNSTLEIFDRTGHLFWWEHPMRSARAIREHALAAAPG